MAAVETERRTKRGPYAKTAQKRVEIVEAATTVFAARGYRGGSLRDIARQMDLSLTSVIHHFPAKTDLLEAVLDRADGGARAWFDERASRDGLKAAILELVRINLGRPELVRLLAIVSSEASTPDHPAHGWFEQRYRNLRDGVARSIEEDVAANRLRPVGEPRRVARAILATWDGLQLQWLLEPDTDMHGDMALALDRMLPG